MASRARLDFFLNLGHFIDHLAMLIFPTAVLAIGVAWQRPYSELLPLALGGFIAFGAFSIPAGWLADRWSRTGMMRVFFFGIGVASILTGLARTSLELAAGLTAIGLFAAIYHPVGIAMLVRSHPKTGQALGVNGFFGNLGVAFAALVTGAFAGLVGWRAAFVVPGLISIAAGIAFALLVPRDAEAYAAPQKPVPRVDRDVLIRVFAVVLITTACGGVIFNATTVSLPKIFDERLLALAGGTVGVGALAALVFVIAAVAQLIVGPLIDRVPLKFLLLPIAGLQAPLFLMASHTEGVAMFVVAAAMMFLVFGQIPINDAMIARYTADRWRARAYAARYVVSFAASAVAVPLIALLHDHGGGFRQLFVVLAIVASLIFLGALAFPRPAPAPAAQPAE
jgi:MFS family permease